jgi:hypothetical protein
MAMSTKNAAKAVLLDGLSDLEQAAIARKYESKTGRPFGCEPCAAARAHTKASEEPASEVIAVVDEAGEITPLCEACYTEFIANSATS